MIRVLSLEAESSMFGLYRPLAEFVIDTQAFLLL